MSSLVDVAIFLAAAVVAVPLFRLLKLSAIIGYIIAGVAIGPWGFGLISGVEEILVQGLLRDPGVRDGLDG